MTIPSDAERNFCPSCEAECNDHPSICTVCGTELQYAENESRTTQRRPTTRPGSTGHALLASLQALQQLPINIAGTGGGEDLQLLVQQVQSLRDRIVQGDAGLLNAMAAGGDVWETIPAELLNPNAAGLAASNSRATSKEYLQHITRIKLGKDSSLFYQASVSLMINSKTVTFDAVPADFGGLIQSRSSNKGSVESTTSHTNSIHFDAATTRLILADPRTGKGGRLSALTMDHIKHARDANNTIILYMERGDNVSFVTKARMAQDAGAKVLVVGNNQAEPWPYIMKDSSSNTTTTNHDPVDIACVMVKQSDGQALVRACRNEPLPGVSFAMERSDSHDCIICQEAYQDGASAIRIPACGHVFHEACAMVWLTQHNTCPFCRRELPTDDAEYERERRRQQRTHAGSQGQDNTQYQEFYG